MIPHWMSLAVVYLLGVCLGFAAMVFAVGMGLGSLFAAYPALYDVLRVVAVVYMLWLAWRIATSQGLGVLQCGDPKGDGTGGPGYEFANEYPTDQYPPNDPRLQQPVTYPRGTLAMARTSDPNSAGSQFFICLEAHGHLDRQYTAFGRTADDESLAVVKAVGAMPTDHNDRPTKPVTIQRATVEAIAR